MLEGAWVQKDEAMKALHKVLRYKFSLGQTTASTLHESRSHAWGRVGSKGWSYEGFAQSAALQVLTWANYSKYFARTTWFTCLREGGFKRMKLWRLCTKCCVTSSHLGKLQQVLCTNHGYMLEGGWVQKDAWSYEGFAQSAALQVLTWANYSKYFARITVTCLREGGFKRMKLWRLCTKCCVTSSHLGKLQQVLCTNHVVHVLDTLGRVDSKGWSCWGITLYWGKEWHLPTVRRRPLQPQ